MERKLHDLETWELEMELERAESSRARAVEAVDAARGQLRRYVQRIENIQGLLKEKPRMESSTSTSFVYDPILASVIKRAGAPTSAATMLALMCHQIHHLLTNGRGYARLLKSDGYQWVGNTSQEWADLFVGETQRSTRHFIRIGRNLDVIQTKRTNRGNYYRVDYQRLLRYYAEAVVPPPEWLTDHSFGEPDVVEPNVYIEKIYS